MVKHMSKYRGKRVRFYEKKHSYIWGSKKLTSVNQLLDQLFEPFDARAIARKLSKFPINKERGRGVRYWLEEWRKKAEMGTKIHKEIEDYNPVHPLSKVGVSFRDSFLRGKRIDGIESERFVFSPDHGVCGTVDLVAYRKDKIDGKESAIVYVIDWKTNDKISGKNYDGKMGVSPLTSHLEDTKLNRYFLQLNLYAYLYLEKNYLFSSLSKEDVCVRLKVAHIKIGGVDEYDFEYDEELAKKVLEDYKERSGWVPYPRNDNTYNSSRSRVRNYAVPYIFEPAYRP